MPQSLEPRKIHDGQTMQKRVRQTLKRWNKTDHIHWAARAYASNDLLGYLRNFFMLINNWNNSPETEETLRRTIFADTGEEKWTLGSISNGINSLEKKYGEIERVNAYQVRWNPEIVNMGGSQIVRSSYGGTSVKYSVQETALIEKLKEKYQSDFIFKTNHEIKEAIQQREDELFERLTSLTEMLKAALALLPPAERERLIAEYDYDEPVFDFDYRTTLRT